VAIAGLLVLCRALRPETPYLALLAASAIIASGAAEDVPNSVELRWRPGDHQAALTVSS
jgi:hypothetical protein